MGAHCSTGIATGIATGCGSENVEGGEYAVTPSSGQRDVRHGQPFAGLYDPRNDTVLYGSNHDHESPVGGELQLQAEGSAASNAVPNNLHLMPSRSMGEEMLAAGAEGFVPTFLNSMGAHVWPFIDEFSLEVITKTVEPAVKKALGSLGQGFSFERKGYSLGSRPGEIKELKMHKVTRQSRGGPFSSLVVRAEIEWIGDISMHVDIAKNRFSSASLDVRNITLRGQLIVEFTGMIPHPPMFQGVSAYFVNLPSLDVDFHGNGLTALLNFTTVKRMILETVLDQLSKKLVVPNRHGLKLDKNADFFRIMKPRPRGVMVMTVDRANHIVGMDSHMFSRQKTSDAYAVVRCGAESFRSTTVHKTLSPVFHFSVPLPLLSPVHQRIQVTLFDEDTTSADDFLGDVDLMVRDLITWGQDQRCLPLQDKEGKTGKNGEVHIGAQYRPLLVEPDGSNAGAMVFVGVYWASHVPAYSDGTTFWVEAQCTGLMPGPRSSHTTQTSNKQKMHETQAASLPDKVAKKQQSLLLQTKIGILKSHGVSVDDMATILDIDCTALNNLLKGASVDGNIHAGGRTQLDFNHAFEFLVAEPDNFSFSLDLKRETDGVIESLGCCKLKNSEIVGGISQDAFDDAGVRRVSTNRSVGDPQSCAQQTLELPGTHICLKVCTQLLHLGNYSCNDNA